MKTIPLREFQQNARKYLKKLPVILTKYNLPVAMVVPFKGLGNTEIEPPSGQAYVMPGLPERREGELKPIEEPDDDYPKYYLGKPLSGKKATCPICYEVAPVEFAQQHYIKKHGDI